MTPASHSNTPLACSVVIPATDSPATLDKCIAAIEASSPPPSEVIVVSEPESMTPAAARNSGSGEATTEILVFVDADVVVNPDTIARLVGVLEADYTLSAVFGSYDSSPSAPGVVSGFRFLLHHWVHQGSAGDSSSFWTGIGAIRRDVFLQAGGFDPDRRFLEDIDLGLRLHTSGRRTVLDPAAQGTHLKELSLIEMVRSDALERGVPLAELLVEHRRGGANLNLGGRNRLLAAIALAIAIFTLSGRPRSAMACFATFAAVDLPFLRLVTQARGVGAAVASVPLHLLHLMAGISGLTIGFIRAIQRRSRRFDPVSRDESQRTDSPGRSHPPASRLPGRRSG